MQSAPPRVESNTAVREPGVAAVLSVVPGMGQIYNGETRKGFLFLVTGTINCFILLFWLFRAPILTTSATVAKALHMKLNDQLVASVLDVGPKSPQSFIVLTFLIAFILFAMQDAFKQARLIRKSGIYPSSVLAISEAATGSYIMHFVLLAVSFLLVFLFLVPPPPHPQIMDVTFVDSETETKKTTKSEVHAQKSSDASGRHEPDKKISAGAAGQRSLPKPQSQKAEHTQQKQTQPAPTSSQKPPAAKPNRTEAPHPPAPSAHMPVPPTPPTLPALIPPPVPPRASSVGAKPTAPSPTVPRETNVQLPPHPVLTAANSGQKLAMVPAPMPTQSTALSSVAPPAPGHHAGPSPSQLPGAPAPITDSSLKNDSMPQPQPGSGEHSRSHDRTADGAPHPSATRTSHGPSTDELQQLRPTPGDNGTGKDPGTTNVTKPGKTRQVDTDRDVDFTSYMLDLQRRIKRAWFPPPNTQSRRVTVLFKIHTNGELSNLRVEKSSGLALYDNAALRAVENAAPFRPLPLHADENVDIQFTFDYNVFTGGGGGGAVRNF
jgi:TonB family protein